MATYNQSTPTTQGESLHLVVCGHVPDPISPPCTPSLNEFSVDIFWAYPTSSPAVL